MKNIVREIKTTFIGLFIIAFGVVSFIREEFEAIPWMVRLGIMAVGVLFLFAPDRILKLALDKLKGIK